VKAILMLIPVALALGSIGLIAFLWSLRTGQFEDLDGAANRILFDYEKVDESKLLPVVGDDEAEQRGVRVRKTIHGSALALARELDGLGIPPDYYLLDLADENQTRLVCIEDLISFQKHDPELKVGDSVMTALCQGADKLGISLRLIVASSPVTEGLSRAALHEWYPRFGFEKVLASEYLRKPAA